MALPRPTFGDFRVRRREAMDAAFFDRRFRTLVDMLVIYAQELDRLATSSDTLVETGLERIDSILSPALTRLQQAAELGFLVATSTTSLGLQEGGEAVFEISPQTRDLFTPTPFLTISRSTPGAEGQYAVAQLVAWNPATGGLDVEVLAIEGITGAHADWVISASSGLPASMIARAAQVTADAAQAAADRAFIESVSSAIQQGPVVSVAGKTGAVSLVMGDIANLVVTLAAKADAAHSHPQSSIVNLVADLAAKAPLSHTQAISTITGLQTELDAKAIASEVAAALALKADLAAVVGRQTLWIPAGAMKPRTTSGAARGTLETTTNKVLVETLDFDAATQEFAQFSIRMPKGWNEGTLSFQPVWSHATAAANFGVVWALEAVAFADGDAMDVAFGSAVQVSDTGGAANAKYIGAESGPLTVAGNPGPQEVVHFQVKRVPADAADTLSIDARLHGMTVFYITDAATDA